MDKQGKWGALALTAAVLLTACERNVDPTQASLLANTVVGQSMLSADVPMPVSVSTTTSVSSCDNSPGPYITVNGALAIAGLGSRLVFTNNANGTHTFTDQNSATVTVIPNGDAVTIPKQPVLGGVGGNPFIWIQFTDDRDNPMSDEIYLGRCVQGLNVESHASFTLPASAVAQFTAAGCTNNPGPTITLWGDLTVKPGIGARLIFRNNDNPVGGPHQADAATTVKVALLPPGETVQFPKQPVLGGVGGNPWIWFQFLSADGADLTTQQLLGRCVQLNQG